MNKALVQGQRVMNLAGEDKSIESFASSFKEQYGLNMQAKKQETAQNQKWADTIGLPENILKVEEGDRDTVLDWNQGMRDKFVDAMQKYDESGDDKDRRIADEILIKVRNLNNQLGEFQLDKQKYLADFEAGNLLPGQFDAEFYSNNYTKNKASAYTINDDGNLVFSDGTLFNEKKDGYKIKFDGGKTLIDETAINATNLANSDIKSDSGDKSFNFRNTQIALDNGFKNPKIGGGAEAVTVLSQTDLNDFDDQNVSFANEYVNGLLPDEIYKMLQGSGIDDGSQNYAGPKSATQNRDSSKRDAKWMEDPGNTDLLRKMISTYVARGAETVYNNKYDEEFGIRADKGFLSYPQGKVKSELLRTTFSAGATKNLYDMIKLGKKDDITIAGTKITSNGNGTYTTAGIGNVVTQAMVDDGSYKKEQLGNQITARYANSQELIEKLGINDKDFERLVSIPEQNVPGGDVPPPTPPPLPTKKNIDFFDVFDGKFNENRVSALEKQYPGLKMKINGINSDFYMVSYKGGEPVKIEFNRANDTRNKRSQKALNKLLKGI